MSDFTFNTNAQEFVPTQMQQNSIEFTAHPRAFMNFGDRREVSEMMHMQPQFSQMKYMHHMSVMPPAAESHGNKHSKIIADHYGPAKPRQGLRAGNMAQKMQIDNRNKDYNKDKKNRVENKQKTTQVDTYEKKQKNTIPVLEKEVKKPIEPSRQRQVSGTAVETTQPPTLGKTFKDVATAGNSIVNQHKIKNDLVTDADCRNKKTIPYGQNNRKNSDVQNVTSSEIASGISTPSLEENNKENNKELTEITDNKVTPVSTQNIPVDIAEKKPAVLEMKDTEKIYDISEMKAASCDNVIVNETEKCETVVAAADTEPSVDATPRTETVQTVIYSQEKMLQLFKLTKNKVSQENMFEKSNIKIAIHQNNRQESCNPSSSQMVKRNRVNESDIHYGNNSKFNMHSSMNYKRSFPNFSDTPPMSRTKSQTDESSNVYYPMSRNAVPDDPSVKKMKDLTSLLNKMAPLNYDRIIAKIVDLNFDVSEFGVLTDAIATAAIARRSYQDYLKLIATYNQKHPNRAEFITSLINSAQVKFETNLPSINKCSLSETETYSNILDRRGECEATVTCASEICEKNVMSSKVMWIILEKLWNNWEVVRKAFPPNDTRLVELGGIYLTSIPNVLNKFQNYFIGCIRDGECTNYHSVINCISEAVKNETIPERFRVTIKEAIDELNNMIKNLSEP